MANEAAVRTKDITVIGEENFPAGGGFMILPSRLSLAELVRLEQSLAGRSLKYALEDGAALDPQLRAYVERDMAAIIHLRHRSTEMEAYRKSIQDAIHENAVVIYLPSEAATLSAPLTTVSGERLAFLLGAEAPVVPVYSHRPADVAMSIEKLHSKNESILAIGRVIDGLKLTLADYQESLFLLSEQAFARYPMLKRHLAWAVVKGFKKHGSRNVVVDGKDGQVFRFDKIFAAAITLSRYLRSETTKKRVGIILPPGSAGLIANVAVLLAGKTPVNLNFTASRQAAEFAMKQGEMDRFITADIFVRKMQSFPWPPMKQLILLERLFPRLKKKSVFWFLVSKVLPAPLLSMLLGVPRNGGREEATLLFTSGSSGDPKGVILSHRNILANVAQFGCRLNLKSSDAILGCLPLFHSFGCTVTLWYPLIQGMNIVTYPTPLEIKKLAELIEKNDVTLLVATPTFLRGYLKGVNSEQLATIKLCVTGAEKLPKPLAEAFESKFGKRVFEGYGLTETSPVSNVNLPDPDPLSVRDGASWLPSYRLGSVGQLMPGLAVRITSPDHGGPLPIHQPGMIWFKGANIFEGYLRDPKRTADVLTEDGWFRTGDIGRVDEDGFLYIEGRLSRFSKIGGEMVPHETVEDTLLKAMGLENESTRRIAVVGVPDPEKGEALVLITSVPGGPEHQDILELRYRLLERGVPALWIPRRMVRVADIPLLASGKLDMQACERIARSGAPS